MIAYAYIIIYLFNFSYLPFIVGYYDAVCHRNLINEYIKFKKNVGLHTYIIHVNILHNRLTSLPK